MSSMSISRLLATLLFGSFFISANAANSISVSKSCFTVGEDISITFQADSPKNDDWIGIFSPSQALSSLPDPDGIKWIWTCGRRSCSSTVGIAKATVSYTSTLEVGTWKVVLAHNSGPPYAGLAQSATFSVKTSCTSGSNPSPVRSPTRNPTPTPTRLPTVRVPVRTPTRLPTVRVPVTTPVRSPTRPPTRAPATPTSASSLTTNKASFVSGEKIVISFKNGVPIAQDWIGVYPSSANSNNLGQGDLWLWTCGSQSCGSSPGSGSATFDSGSSWVSGDWPLPVGSYKAFILRNNGLNANGGFVAVAVSATFTVKANTAVSTGTAAAVASAKSDISNIIVGNGGNSDLAAMFLRLAFHDCVGGCDGCVDLTNPENFGLLTPIQALRPVVSKFANSQTKLTRADIWALSSAVGAEVMQTTDRVSFDLLSVGRVNCEDANTVCRNEQGNVHDCSDIRGPSRHHPSMNLNSRDLFGFFSDEFGFSTKQTVAIMGAHTLGKLRKANSGIDGPNGWLINNKVFDNEYYRELIGGNSASDSLTTHIDDAPGWQRGVEKASNGFPDQNIWVGFPNGIKIVLLNVDVAIVRNLNTTNMDQNGKVNCNFRRTGRCPENTNAIQFAIDYAFDNKLWLNDFRDVLTIMLNNGYTRTSTCDGNICFLSPK